MARGGTNGFILTHLQFGGAEETEGRNRDQNPPITAKWPLCESPLVCRKKESLLRCLGGGCKKKVIKKAGGGGRRGKGCGEETQRYGWR